VVGEIMNMTVEKEYIEKLIEEEDMLLLYFGSDSCSVCVDLKPKVENILKKYNKINCVYIDMNENLKLSREFNIFTMPAILLYVDGKEVIREARYLSVYELEDKIDRYYSLLFEE